jgi:hypothetical protein
MYPAFCLTDYKVQGSTLAAAILDLKDSPTTRGQDHQIITGSITRCMCSYPGFDPLKGFISCRNSICMTSDLDPIVDC